MGAWIETTMMLIFAIFQKVAPYVGAWIETYNVSSSLTQLTSHPTWVRGLKLILSKNRINGRMSHPTWVRGLKHQSLPTGKHPYESHPTWVRGLKRPLARNVGFHTPRSHPTWVRGLKLLICPNYDAFGRRTLRGCVD